MCILKLPYINADHSREIKKVILHSNLPILPMFTSGSKLNNILTTTNLEKSVCHEKACPFKNSLCKRKNVVYELTCTICHHKYVGETKRELHHRLREHRKAIVEGKLNISAMAEP